MKEIQEITDQLYIVRKYISPDDAAILSLSDTPNGQPKVFGDANTGCFLDLGDKVTTKHIGPELLGINSQTCRYCRSSGICRSHNPELAIIPVGEIAIS